MIPLKNVSKFTNEDLNGKTVELNIREDGKPVVGMYIFDSWANTDGDGIVVEAHSQPGSELREHRIPNAIAFTSVRFPQYLVDLIERHPDQSVAAFQIVFQPMSPPPPRS